MAQSDPLAGGDTEKQMECANFEAPDGNHGSAQSQNGYLGFHAFTEDIVKPKKKRHTWKLIVLFLVLCALFMGGLLLGYYIRHTDENQRVSPTRGPCTQPVAESQSGSDPRHLELIHENLMYSMNGDRIATQLSNFTLLEVYSGSLSDGLLIEIIKSAFSRAGLEDLQKYNGEYEILMSFPNRTKPNMIQIIQNYGLIHMEPDLNELCRMAHEMNMSNDNCQMPDIQEPAPEEPSTTTTTTTAAPEDVVRDAQSVSGGGRKQKMSDIARAMMEAEQNAQAPPELKADPRALALEQHMPYVAYTPSGIAHGELVYMNYGTHEDFVAARKLGVSVSGKVALIRVGKIANREKIRMAESNGVIGILLYRDPADIPYKEECTKDAPFLQANDEDMGDPLTPGYPATRGMLRGTVEEADLPTIPVQSASCHMAYYLLSNLSQTAVPDGWQGGFNLSYYMSRRTNSALVRWTVGWLGSPWTVRIVTENQLTPGPVYNVIGRLTGQVDPDHYVIIGANRNSFTRGQHGAVIGTSALIEFTRNLAYLIHRENWRPKRTLMLCSWGGGDFGNIGMVEFLQEYKDVLAGRVVSYINLDDPVLGDYVLGATTTASLESIIYNVAQRVPSPDEQQYMVYDTWMKRTKKAKKAQQQQDVPTSLTLDIANVASDDRPEVPSTLPPDSQQQNITESATTVPPTQPPPTRPPQTEAPPLKSPHIEREQSSPSIVHEMGSAGDSSWETVRPYQALLNGQSDPFFTLLGAPTVHLQYTAAPPQVSNYTMAAESAHHYSHHMAVGRVAGLLALSIADATVLQLDLVQAARRLQADIVDSSPDIRSLSDYTADAVSNVSRQLVKAAETWHHYIMTTADFEVENTRRMINERLVQCQEHMAQAVTQLTRIKRYLSGASISVNEWSHERVMTSSDQSPEQHRSYANRELSRLLHSLQTTLQTLKIEL